MMIKTEHSVEFSSPDKLMYPEPGLTKEDILHYYDDISSYMLPHLKDRPLMLQRFPDGVGESGFYQKNASDYFPDWIPRVEVEKEGGSVHHVICNDRDTLLYLVNQGTLAFHSWLSCSKKVDYPDKLVIDLDPSDKDFGVVLDCARAIRDVLEEMSVISWVMTTGSRGLHVVIPLEPSESFEESRETGKLLGRYLVRTHEELFTMETYKKDREGKVYFDIQRNAYAQTAITPWSLRGRSNASVATPVDWKEVTASLSPDKYHVKNIRRRISQKADPWKDYGKVRYSPSELKKKLGKLND